MPPEDLNINHIQVEQVHPAPAHRIEKEAYGNYLAERELRFMGARQRADRRAATFTGGNDHPPTASPPTDTIST